jgi:hypothetical protein
MHSITTTQAASSDTGSDRYEPSRERRLLFWLLALMTATFLVFQSGILTGYDGQTMYAVTTSMIERGTFSVSEQWNTLPGRGGLEYSRYGLGLSLVAAIPYVLARPLAQLTVERDAILAAAVGSIMALISAALVVALYVLARRLGARVGPALLIGVGAVVGTFALPYSKEFFSEPLAALCLVVAIERMVARRPLTAGLAAGAAVLTRPQTLLFAPVLLFVAWRRLGGAAGIRAAAGLTPGVLATFAYNLLRFGDPLSFGYQDVGFTTPFLRGAAGLLFNPLKSVLLFAPIIVLVAFALWQLWRSRSLALPLIGANLAITFIVSATWFAWHGGWSWGPRLLLPAVMPALAPIASWISTPSRRWTAATLLLIGFVISFPALIVSTEAQQLEVPPVPPETHFLDTQPLASPSVARQFELIVPATRYSFDHLYDDQPNLRNDLHGLNLWQFGVVRVTGRGGLVLSVVGSALLLLFATVSGHRLRAVARTLSDRGLNRCERPQTRAAGGEGLGSAETA